jgi:hypothetical protein
LSGSLLPLQCILSTAAWTLIQMPRSKEFTSGEHTDCHIITTLNSSNACLVYSCIASWVPWSPALP